MKILSATTTAIAALLFAGSAAIAKPFIYTSFYSYSGSYKSCIKKAEAALKRLGFERFEHENTNEKNRSVSIAGYHESEYLTAEIECDQKLGITSLGVAGLDNDITYEYYGKLYDSEW